MNTGSSDSALVKPFRSVFRFVGAFIDAVFYFVDSLVNPHRPRNRGRLNDNRRNGSGPRIGMLRPHGSGGNAPNMNIGCKSCQM